MLRFAGVEIVGNTAPNIYQGLKPWFAENGAARWIIDNELGQEFVDSDGTVYLIRKRTQAELEATPEYQAWAGTQPLPTLYAAITLSGGDGKTPLGLKLGHATKGTMSISGDVRLTPDAPGLPVNITFEWRITLRKVVSEFATTPIDSFPVDGCTVVNNVISMTFDPAALGVTPGVYLMSDEDFATIPGAAFGLASDYQVKLVGGAKYFKVLK